ncbi:hypothetical protein IscW_ISCW003945 [Ixodes scapularis]|uniref:Uncharacterized protein n=1 Tax=Ixodes scapularis TaxID=6945 RepID=B7PII6_IXOSC|nr:hypothetical protein IscW_ISCW003945 [Ixodes scapularis]|eukprot:XP_002405312.1 hypothetical protein IscW_ISCW003945 [Ixodes scapularis]
MEFAPVGLKRFFAQVLVLWRFGPTQKAEHAETSPLTQSKTPSTVQDEACWNSGNILGPGTRPDSAAADDATATRRPNPDGGGHGARILGSPRAVDFDDDGLATTHAASPGYSVSRLRAAATQ